MPPKNDKEYLAQGELYFSESAGEFVRIADMIPQYALNCFKKCKREMPNFIGSQLSIGFYEKLVPTVQKCRAELKKHGKVLIYLGTDEPGMGNTTKFRSRLRQAGATKTHRVGEWLEGYAEPSSVKVKGKVIV